VRDIQEILREKECAIERVRREVEALRSVSPFLSDSGPSIPHSVRSETSTDRVSQLREALNTVAPLLVDETDGFDPGLRARLVEAGESDRTHSRAKKISHHLRQWATPLLGASSR
jgi:hypothetical protein